MTIGLLQIQPGWNHPAPHAYEKECELYAQTGKTHSNDVHLILKVLKTQVFIKPGNFSTCIKFKTTRYILCCCFVTRIGHGNITRECVFLIICFFNDNILNFRRPFTLNTGHLVFV